MDSVSCTASRSQVCAADYCLLKALSLPYDDLQEEEIDDRNGGLEREQKLIREERGDVQVVVLTATPSHPSLFRNLACWLTLLIDLNGHSYTF